MDISLPQLFDMEMAQLKMECEKDPDDVIWRFSPLDIKEFDIMLNVAYNVVANDLGGEDDIGRRFSFVEAGSGIGTKLYLAKNKYMLDEYGYEINQEYVDKARALGVSCEQRDLAADPQPIWAAYDIVYTCRPFKNDVFEHQWEKSVHDAMRPGAVLMAAFVSRKPYSWPCYYRFPFRGVWQKPVLSPDDVTSKELALAATV